MFPLPKNISKKRIWSYWATVCFQSGTLRQSQMSCLQALHPLTCLLQDLCMFYLQYYMFAINFQSTRWL